MSQTGESPSSEQLSESELRVRQHGLFLLEKNLPEYVGGEHIQDEIRSSRIHFFPVTGPVGVGKTAITSLAATIRADAPMHLIDTITTRAGKPSDPPGFLTADHGITLESLQNEIANHNLVNYSVIRKTGQVYATAADGFKPGLNTGPVTSSNIETFLKYNFDEFAPIYIISPVEMWSRFLKKSVGERPDLISDRADESIESLEFAKANLDLFKFIDNIEGGLEHAAHNLVSIATHGSYPIILPEYAEARIDKMIAEAKRLSVQ